MCVYIYIYIYIYIIRRLAEKLHDRRVTLLGRGDERRHPTIYLSIYLSIYQYIYIYISI